MENEQNKKVYRITFGDYELYTDKRKKHEINESYNVEQKNILGFDVYDALNKVSDYLLAKEKEYKKDNLGIFIESVELICDLDTMNK